MMWRIADDRWWMGMMWTEKRKGWMEVEVGLRGAGRFNHQSCHITAQPQLSRWGLERRATSPFCFFRANSSLDCVHACP